MATFKLNIARIRGCPPPPQVAAAMDEFGLPDDEEFGVLQRAATAETVSAVIVRKTLQTVQAVDAEAHEVTSRNVEKATVYPVTVRPSGETLEIHAGPASAIEQVGLFFSGCLAFATVTEAIETDLRDLVDKLSESTNKFQLVSARVSDYSANSFMTGPYQPKFLDTQHGLDFLDQYAAGLTSAKVR